jgi:hypothetical protein
VNPVKVYLSQKKKELWTKYVEQHPEKFRSLSEMCVRVVDNEVFGLEPNTNHIPPLVDNTQVLAEVKRLAKLIETREKDRKKLDFIAEEIRQAAPPLDAEIGRVAELLELAGTLRVDALARILRVEMKIALACLIRLKDEGRVELNESMEWIWNGE